ncbi:MAG: peptide chain release factor 1 [Candidatus Dojkabacteria bacterium]|nr:peptide chain release factor 1 [Candidatus Dojkabacteria bacterium]
MDFEDIDISSLRTRFDELNSKVLNITDFNSPESKSIISEYNRLKETIETYEEILNIQKQIEQNEELKNDPELEGLVSAENESLQSKFEKLKQKLQLLLLPPNPNDEKNVILEIRAGTGGEEATLFAGDLFRMYNRYANSKGWTVQVLSISESDTGGIKEIIAKIIGKGVYKMLKGESGVHRVQRIPVTEANGRIHTSAASVVVMPEIDDIEIVIKPEDIRIDVFRSAGHGGQSVNTTDSAVRITHLPTGLIVTCQDTKDQHKNKESALSVLRARLYQMELEKQQGEISNIRKSAIKTGDRSDKIKTYNFPQNRLTDHRINKTWYDLENIMEGNLDEIINEYILSLSNSWYQETACGS